MVRIEELMIQFFVLALALHGLIVRSETLNDRHVLNGGLVSVSMTSRRPYTRDAEVKEKCPLLTLREQDSTQSIPRWTLMDKLSFHFGDWEKADSGAHPLMPFTPSDSSLPTAAAQLVSLRILDIGRGPDMVRSVNGMMELMIVDTHSRDRVVQFAREAKFVSSPGESRLFIEVEGIYQQAENEDVVCLLGCTYLPSSNEKVKDCDIMIQLHYPLTFNLTSRVIRGTVQSTSGRTDFSPVTLTSQVIDGRSSRTYEATARDLVYSACSNVSGPILVKPFKPSRHEFCQGMQEYMEPWNNVLKLKPNWNCNTSSEYCQKIGPFSNNSAHTAFQMDYNKSRVELIIQNFRHTCAPEPEEEVTEISVSFVLRLVPADEYFNVAHDRTALDGQTLVAEGTWKEGSDTFCAVGCKLDDSSGQADACHARICFQIPTTLSIRSRNMLEGRISSLLPESHADSFFPLEVFLELRLNWNFPALYRKALRYNYTVLENAAALLHKFESSPDKSLKVPWSKHPSLAGGDDSRYSALAEDLAFQTGLKPGKGLAFSEIDFVIVSLHEYLPFLWSGFVASEVQDTNPWIPVNDAIAIEYDPLETYGLPPSVQYLNCSGSLTFSNYDIDESNVFSIFVEGYYIPRTGKMYMMGCRNIKGTWQNLHDNSFDLSEGMDCEIEVVLEYPTTVAAWLLKPGVKVKVHSNRPADDLFYFADIELETKPIFYTKQRESIISAQTVEAALSILTLSLVVACIFFQLVYVKRNEESTPYISLLMLGVQAMGFAIPLVTNAEYLLLRKFDYRENYFFAESGSIQIITYADKIFSLIALVLLLWLFEKVWRERALLSDQHPSARVPHERKVVVICFIIHALGFMSVMALHSQKLGSGDAKATWNGDFPTVTVGQIRRNVTSIWGGSREPDRIKWTKVLQEYAGLVEDLFLLPQAIAFAIWEVRGKPLQFLFLGGLTLLQIVPHIYDHIRGPGLTTYPMYANPNFDFYTDVGNILIPVLALLLAIIVYSQQRWNGFRRFPTKFLYQRLGTKQGETELISANGRNHLPSIPEDE